MNILNTIAHIGSVVLLCGFTHAQPIELMTASETEILRPADGEIYGAFGSGIDVDGDRAVISSPFSDEAGAAYIYEFNGVTWVETAKIVATDKTGLDRFGAGAAISGDTVILSAQDISKWDGGKGTTSGSAFIYRYDGEEWIQETQLFPSDAPVFPGFGVAVSIDNDVAVVGVPADTNSKDQFVGAVYIYRYDGTQWNEEAKLIPSDGLENDGFGVSTTISGDTCLVGAPGADSLGGTGDGAVYVFQFDGTGWFEQSPRLLPSSPFRQFGSALALEDDVAIIGAPKRGRGRARLYRFNGTDWIHETALAPPDGMDYDEFGSSVDLSDGFALVGAWHSGGEFGYDTGAGYLFQNNGSDWILRAKLTKGDGNTEVDDYFGSAVALSGSQALVGAYNNHSIPGTAGAVYNYDTTDLPCPQDFDLDGSLDIFDVFAFLKGWNAQNPLTDWNSSGSIDHTDLFGYIDDFLEACP